MSKFMGRNCAKQIRDIPLWSIDRPYNPVKENITVLARSVFPEECFTEDKIAARLAIGNDVQHELVSPGNPVTVICFAGLEAINPADFNARFAKHPACVCFRSF